MSPQFPAHPVTFTGAFLTHPDWQLNAQGKVEVNALGTELKVMGERGRGSERRPYAWRIPLRFVDNLTVADQDVQFSFINRQGHTEEGIFGLRFAQPEHAARFVEAIPTGTTATEAPPERSAWRVPGKAAPWARGTAQGAAALLLLLSLAGWIYGLRQGADISSAGEALARDWGNHGAATLSGEYWRILTHGCVHQDLLTLGVVVIGLLWLGQRTVETLGKLVWWSTWLLVGTTVGLISLSWHLDARWVTGAGAAWFGVLGATWTQLYLDRTTGRPHFRRKLLLYQVLALTAEGFAVEPDFLSLGLALLLGAGVARLAWRPVVEREENPPRIGRALVWFGLGGALIFAALPRYHYLPREEVLLHQWRTVYLTKASSSPVARLTESHGQPIGQIQQLIAEQEQRAVFLTRSLVELQKLDLQPELRSAAEREALVQEIARKQQQTEAALAEYREWLTMREVAQRHLEVLERLGQDPAATAALRRQGRAAREALETFELKYERARQERALVLEKIARLVP